MTPRNTGESRLTVPLPHHKPRWCCLEDMNANELAAYDYGSAGMMAALKAILDGEDDGVGVASAPWENLRRRVLGYRSALTKIAATMSSDDPSRLREAVQLARDALRGGA